MSSNIAIIDWLLAEAAKIPSTDNPLLGSTLKSGDTVIGQLLEEEWQLFRLAGTYHDQMVALAKGADQKDWSKETQEKIDYFADLHQFAQDIVLSNVQHRLEFKYQAKFIGFLEDGSIVTSSESGPPAPILTVRAFELDPKDVAALLGGGDPKKLN